MAAKKYDWGDGNGAIHSVPLQTHLTDLAAQGKSTVNKVPSYVPQPTAKASTTPPASGAAPATAAPAAGTPATTPTASTITPDAQFLAEAAQRAFQRTTQINSLTQEGTDDRTNTATTINRLIENALSDRQKISEGAGKEGLFYSGQLTKRLGDYEQGLGRAKDDTNTAFSQRDAARQAALAAINQGAPLDEAVAMAQAGGRQVTRDTNAADLGALVPNVSAAPSTQVAAVGQLINRSSNSRAGRPYTAQAGAGGEWHVYGDGRRVWVPKRR